ncbi:MAG TPA: hypothetical protein PLQ89_18135, partial [Phycisphaerae bacterium]|nr:hypothetical protein [Phycisphaerae bacterium]
RGPAGCPEAIYTGVDTTSCLRLIQNWGPVRWAPTKKHCSWSSSSVLAIGLWVRWTSLLNIIRTKLVSLPKPSRITHCGLDDARHIDNITGVTIM